ncbi:hypothetical protein EDB84DRAFT_1470801 [Lactarius hengduanensis]|nr:hypothetical protein EDB84DRAFT_1470801 [Lactarius hengduanensis]
MSRWWQRGGIEVVVVTGSWGQVPRDGDNGNSDDGMTCVHMCERQVEGWGRQVRRVGCSHAARCKTSGRRPS